MSSALGASESGKDKEASAYYDVLIGCGLPDSDDRIPVNMHFGLEMQRENAAEYQVTEVQNVLLQQAGKQTDHRFDESELQHARQKAQLQ